MNLWKRKWWKNQECFNKNRSK